MSLIKASQEFRTILDFSHNKISKHKVRQALRTVEVQEVVCNQDTKSYTFVENDINVGMYQIRLSFYALSTEQRSKLKEYGGFKVEIFERSKSKSRSINLSHDKRFKDQYWVKLNNDYKIRMDTLTDIIIHTKRLDELKIFL